MKRHNRGRATSLVVGLVGMVAGVATSPPHARAADVAPSVSADVTALTARADAAYRAERDADVQAALDAALEQGGYDIAWRVARARFAQSARASSTPSVAADHARRGIEAGERAVRLAPARVEGLAWTCANLGLYGGAVGLLDAIRMDVGGRLPKTCTAAARIDPSYADAIALRVHARFLQKAPWPVHDLPAALALFEQAVRAAPHEPWTHHYRYEALGEAGRVETARASLQACVDVDPAKNDVPADAARMQRTCAMLRAQTTGAQNGAAAAPSMP